MGVAAELCPICSRGMGFLRPVSLQQSAAQLDVQQYFPHCFTSAIFFNVVHLLDPHLLPEPELLQVTGNLLRLSFIMIEKNTYRHFIYWDNPPLRCTISLS